MRTAITLVTLLSLMAGCSPAPGNKEVIRIARQPAEFEPLEAVWLIWPPTDHKQGESVAEVTLSIIEALVDDMNIVVTCGDDQACAAARQTLQLRFKESTNLTIQAVPSVELWARDMGPNFVETSEGMLAIADFNFDAWGYADTLDADAETEELYDVKVAGLLEVPVVSSPLISEGGNREVNGKGTLLVTESVEQGRNPHMTRVEMEAEYKRLLGVTKTIWLKQGLHEDDHTFLGPLTTAAGEHAYTVVTTNGHIDEYARFVNDSTILLARLGS